MQEETAEYGTEEAKGVPHRILHNQSDEDAEEKGV